MSTSKTTSKSGTEAPSKTNPDAQPLVLSYLRFSSPDQAKGDSVRRQIEASEAWAEKRGWSIDDRLRDKGVSAFRGLNAATGALAGIISKIDEGTIPPGSYLILENMDRLSRTELMEAIELMLSIIRKRVILVTLNNGREYAKGSFDLTDLIISASELSRANAESQRKSETVGAAWRRKKGKDARSGDGKAITKKLPLWLKTDATGKIVVNEDRAEVVREIFALAADGRGRNWICKRLNKTRKPFGKKPWSTTYVLNILRSRAVIGEFQPHRLTYATGKKKREPEGDPIPDFFPAILDEPTFYIVQRGIDNRLRTGGPSSSSANRTKGEDGKVTVSGKVTETVINLWQGLLHDDGGNRLISKTSKKWRRFYISAGRDGRGKDEVYRTFPAAQLDFAILVRLMDMIPHDGTANVSNELMEIEGRLTHINETLAQLGEAIGSRPLQTLLVAIEQHESEKAGLERRKYALIAEAENTKAGSFPDRISQAVKTIDRVLLEGLTTAERLQLRELIRANVSRIDAKLGKVKIDVNPKADSRDCYAKCKITMTSGEVISWNLRLDYVDYRREGFDRRNPYEFYFEGERYTIRLSPVTPQKARLPDVEVAQAVHPARSSGP